MSARVGRRAARVRAVLDGLGFTGAGVFGWRQRAACDGVDPEWFYPVGSGQAVAEQTVRAKQVCAGCPVRQMCLADVMASEDPGLRWGITGGLSAAERSALFARRRAERFGEVA